MLVPKVYCIFYRPITAQVTKLKAAKKPLMWEVVDSKSEWGEGGSWTLEFGRLDLYISP